MGADLTIGIPAYKAEDTIVKCIMSISLQTVADRVEIIVASDDEDHDYDYLTDLFNKDYGINIPITTLSCEKNTGPGLARQRCLDNCQTPWITFIDADDIFANPTAIENLLNAINSPQIIEVQGAFLQEIKTPKGTMFSPRNDISHPWVFGRLYNVNFLKSNEIKFSDLRAMEDGEFNWKIRMTIDGTPFKINVIDQPVYIWKEGSEHSITRSGKDEDGIPQYNYDLCPVGSTIASIRAAKFCKKRNPFNGGVTKFIVDMMVGQYFTYVECWKKKQIFADQCFFNAKRFYHECYKDIEKDIPEEILNTMYTTHLAEKARDLIGIIPEITFYEFMNEVKNSAYDGELELKAIRAKLPKEILDNDKATGVSIF